MAILSLHNITLSFGGPPILDAVNLQIEKGERVCLVGRNGEGKSSLMKVISGELPVDSGRIVRNRDLVVSRLEQEVPGALDGTVYDIVAGGLGELMELLSHHHHLSHQLASNHDNILLDELSSLEQEMEATGAWQASQRIDTTISRLNLPAEQSFSSLSGGLKRRVLLARALVSNPDFLLLDEPTNHLDIDAIAWLENFLLTAPFALLFVSHDRALIKKLATRIIDLDRGHLTSWPGDYRTYLQRKEEFLQAKATQDARFDRKLAQEEIWIRQGIKARRTRNEGRVRALMELRQQRKERRQQVGTVRMDISTAGLSGKIVTLLKDVSFSFNNTTIIKSLSTTVLRGDRIGIIGPNGVGKTTLLRLLLGELSPSGGTIKQGANLLPVYFDQQRFSLDEEKTVFENLGEGNDTITINGQNKHIMGYLQDFLFTPDRARSPVKILSGGERNRLLLAKLFAKPSNVLILDEPTNDLDMETLELLEELLLEYKGTLLLVSHDRAFLNNVVTSSLVFEGNGHIQEYAGGYDDWLVQQPQSQEKQRETATPVKIKKSLNDAPRELTFKENRELEQLPQQIEAMEEEQAQLFQTMSDPAFYQKEADSVAATKLRLEQLEEELTRAYARWEELEEIHETHRGQA